MAKVFQVNTASGGTLPTSLVSYYKLDGPTGNATDFFASNTLTNTGGVTYSAGLIGDAATFSSGKYFIGSSGLFSYAQSQAFSINCWVQRSATSSYMTILGNSDSNVVGYWFAFQSNNSLGFYIVDSAGNYISRNSVANTNTSWQMVTATYSGSGTQAGLHIYINNVLADSTGTAQTLNGTITTTADPSMGATWNGSSYGIYPMVGQLDEFGIWTKVLSANEMTDLYNGGAGQTMINNSSSALSDSIMNAATSARLAVLTYAQILSQGLSVAIMNAASGARLAVLTYAQVLHRALSDSIMNAASRFATLVGAIIHAYTRALSDSMMNARSLDAILTYGQGKARALSDSIMNAATSARLAVLTYVQVHVRMLSDSIMNAASRLATVATGEVIARFLTVNMMNAASRFTTFIVRLIGSWAFRAKHAATWSFRDKSPLGETDIPSD